MYVYQICELFPKSRDNGQVEKKIMDGLEENFDCNVFFNTFFVLR